ncbi:MAG: tetratricopeptide repeat protein [Flavobacteriales bacterium]|nr:tetratricopeptide repeat protein [Flavobacteriales bacterium]
MKPLLLPLAFLAVLPMRAQQDDALMAGLSALKVQDHSKAEAAFNEALVADPNNAKTWYYRAVNRLVMGDHDGALQDLDHLLLMEPADVHAMLRRAEVYRVLGDDQRANSDLNRVLGFHTVGPAAEHALFELGRIAFAEDDLPLALAHYSKLVEIAPYNAMAWCDRGIVHSALLADDNALTDLERAIELDPTLDQAYVAQADVYFRQGRRQEGCYALQQAHDLGDRTVERSLLINCDQ